MVYVSDRVSTAHRRVSKAFHVSAFDPTREQLPVNTYVEYKASGGGIFRFVAVRLPGSRYRAYITHQPSYGSRPSGSATVHRLMDRHGYYICWVPEPRTVDELIKVMRVWAEATVGYITAGTFAPR